MSGFLGSLLDRHRSAAGDWSSEHVVQPRVRAMFENEAPAGFTDVDGGIDAEITRHTARPPAFDDVAAPDITDVRDSGPQRPIAAEVVTERMDADPPDRIDPYPLEAPGRRDRGVEHDRQANVRTPHSDAARRPTGEPIPPQPAERTVVARVVEIARQIDRGLSPALRADAEQHDDAGALAPDYSPPTDLPRFAPLPDAGRSAHRGIPDARRRASSTDPGQSETIVNVTIGRLEVRAEKPDASLGDGQGERARGIMSLDEYLERRGEERR